MADKRIEKFSSLLLKYSLDLKEGESLLVTGSNLALPLIREIYKDALKIGAFPRLKILPYDGQGLFFTYGNESHFNHLSPIDMYEVTHTDAFLTIQSEGNTRLLTQIDSKRQAIFNLSRKPLKDKILEKGRWNLTLFPTDAYAQDAEMSSEEFEDFVYNACFLDKDDPQEEWNALSQRQSRLIKILDKAKNIRILGEDTDLTLNVEGRKFINSDGRHNMPSGEIFTGPAENEVNGHIRFSYPVVRDGKEVENIRLSFKNGKAVKASARKNEQFLLDMLAMDKGSSFVGELGIGTNYGIDRFIKNILFDEKIGGTIHIALGSSYPETGGKNISALHWDMIMDLRKGGEIYIDGTLFQKNGIFVDL